MIRGYVVEENQSERAIRAREFRRMSSWGETPKKEKTRKHRSVDI